MTQTSGEAAARLTTLTTTSLPALRAYLDGQSRLRRGDALNAAKDFDRAVKADSTFALAGLGLRMATSWYGDQELGNRGLQLALKEKARLSLRDQALLTALAGPRYPDVSTNTELLNAREQYLAYASDNAEAWYLMADHIFHSGAALGYPDWEERALAGFKKAMELDSLYLPGYSHALPLAPSLGDTEFMNHVLRLRTRADTGTFWRKQHDWYMAARAGDDAGAAKALQVDTRIREGLLQGVIRHMQFDGTGAPYARSAIEELVRTSATEALRRGRARYAHDVMMNLGRPEDARRYLAMSKDSANDLNVKIIVVRDAILGEGDQASAMESAAYLTKLEAGPEPTDSAGLQIRRALTRVMEPWRIMRGDTSQSRRSIARLRTIARAQPKVDSAQAHLEIAYLEMIYSMASKSPGLRAVTQRMDSMFLDQNFNGAHTGRTSQHAIALGRAWEQLGEPKRALSAVVRFPNWNSEVMPYWAAQVEETARTAVRAGDKKRAIRSYKSYLGMRAVAEPSMKPQIDSVKRELAAVSR